jgi:hypothetical protein
MMKEAGGIEIDGKAAAATCQCSHCGGHFPFKPIKAGGLFTPEAARVMNSRGVTMRGWCSRCNGPVCGPRCAECIPWQRKLENVMKGLPQDFKPILVSVPRSIDG